MDLSTPTLLEIDRYNTNVHQQILESRPSRSPFDKMTFLDHSEGQCSICDALRVPQQVETPQQEIVNRVS